MFSSAPTPIAPPKNLRMVVGDPFRRTYDASNPEHRAISHACLEPGTEEPELPGACGRMRTQTFFPSCWDGVNMDTPNHKSHVSLQSLFPRRLTAV
jgi:hypothetical protein